MKIKLDTENKTIAMEEKITLDEFFKLVKKLLPNNEWKEYTLETEVVINNWQNPIIIKEREPYPQYPLPWINTPVFGTGENNTVTVNPGTYCIDIQSQF